MLKCWQANADEQPLFSKLVELVSTDLENQAGYLELLFSLYDVSQQRSVFCEWTLWPFQFSSQIFNTAE